MLGLVGENGAGKSTLMNILGGGVPPDSGSMVVENRAYAPGRPSDARDAGIAFVHQELTLFPNLTIAENLQIARFPVHRRLPWIDREASTQAAAGLSAARRAQARTRHVGWPARCGRTAARRDRPGARRRCETPDPRRADHVARLVGARASARAGSRAARRWHVGRLHLPRARGCAAPVRSDCRPQGWSRRRKRQGGGVLDRHPGAPDGRAGGPAALSFPSLRRLRSNRCSSCAT